MLLGDADVHELTSGLPAALRREAITAGVPDVMATTRGSSFIRSSR